MTDVEREEVAIIGGVTAFALLWSFIVVPYISATPWFVNLYPLWAYLVYNVGWIISVTVLFGGLVGYLVSGEFNMVDTFRVGVASWLGFSFVFDMLQPPLYLSTSGQVLIPLGGQALENTAVDAMAAELWHSLLGNAIYQQVPMLITSVSVWFVLTYVLTPFIALVSIALIVSPRRFVELFEGAL